MHTTPKQLEEEWKYWYPRVYGYFFKRVEHKSTIDDLTVMTLTSCFIKFDQIDNKPAYMWRSAHNHLVNYIRTKKTEPILIGVEEIEQVETVIDPIIEAVESDNYKSFRAKMHKCIDTHAATDNNKQLLQLSLLEEKNSTEIGSLLGIKPPTVRKQISRLINKLKSNCLQLFINLTTSYDS